MSRFPRWWRSVRAVNEVLYFDISDASSEQKDAIIAAYNEFFSNEPVEAILMLSSGWAGDFHDPDVPYERGGDNDHHYSARLIESLVQNMGTSAEAFEPVLDAFLQETHNSAFVAVNAIAKHVDSPVDLVTWVVAQMEAGADVQVCVGLTRSIISGARQRTPPMDRECLDAALGVDQFKAFSPSLVAAGTPDDCLVGRIVQSVKDETVSER
ncbi:MAG: hypothetical protein AAF636_22330 [Pseudomonadota bacterium]